MRLRIQAKGSATKASMWDAYADPERWHTWAPHLTEVRADGPLRPGLEGEVRGWLGASARFQVTEVDEQGGRWTWEVRSGPIHLVIEHEVDDGRTAVVLHGPFPVAAAYAPLARRALERLVRLPSQR
jgi:hypothetical protein